MWIASSERTESGPLDGGLAVDRAVGVGVAGLTTAFELVEAGRSGAVVERDRVLDRPNRWSEVYRPTRFDFGASKRDLFEHNAHAMKPTERSGFST